MFRRVLFPVLLSLAAASVHAHDERARAALGAGVGAAIGAVIGSELGGRNEAILGSAIGGAVGAAIATRDRRDHYRPYRRARHHDRWSYRRYDHRDYRRHYRRQRGGRDFCPPGLAKQGRC